jgi:putative transposase
MHDLLLRKRLYQETLDTIESSFSATRTAARNAKRFQNGMQVLSWFAAGLLIAEKEFDKIKGYKQLPYLRAALQKELGLDQGSKMDEVTSA